MTDIEELKTWCQKAIGWHPDSIIHKVGSALLRFLKAEEAKPAEVPVCYGIFTSEGKMCWSEHCIGDKAEDLEAELEILQEDDPDDGWEIRPMYAAAPAPAPVTGESRTKVPVGVADGRRLVRIMVAGEMPEKQAAIEAWYKTIRHELPHDGKTFSGTYIVALLEGINAYIFAPQPPNSDSPSPSGEKEKTA